jgi:DNA invertase Pin-like site-specific DNA recombinase
MIRQILGAVTEFEKATIVAKLRGARECKRRVGDRVEGRRRLSETPARKLARKPRAKAAPSLREIAAALAKHSHLTSKGTKITPQRLSSSCDR